MRQPTMGDMPFDSTTTRRGIFLARLVANEPVCRNHFRMTLRLASFPASHAGQFIQVLCCPPDSQPVAIEADWLDGHPHLEQQELLGKTPLLRRPLGVAGRRDDATGVELDVIYRVSGIGTRWLSQQPAGVEIGLLGPLGNSFLIRDDVSRAALVGGGVGIPPLLCLANELAAAGRETTAFFGARTAELLPVAADASQAWPDGRPAMCVPGLTAMGVDAAITTDDGSLGFKGVAGAALERWLDYEGLTDGACVVYTCGPEPLMRAVSDLCASRGLPCQVCLERHMACGMGTCQGCAVKLRDDSKQGWSYKLCCTDGPVFDSRAVIW